MKNLCLFLPFLFLTSCATITRGVHEKLSVVSEPSGAEVKLSTGEKGITPATFVKSRKESFTLSVNKAGYNPQTVKVESKFSATGGTAMAGNAIAGGIVGIGIDAMSGATSSLYPNPVSVHLTPQKKSSTKSPAPKKKSQTRASPPKKEPPNKEPEIKPLSPPTPEPKAPESNTPAPSPTPE